MSFSQADLDTLDRAIATGTREVDVDGRRVRYRSLTELYQARQMVVRALAAGTPARVPGYVNPAFDGGV
jgi:hypothetical protein